MNTERLCPECGRPLPEGELRVRCPPCLLRLALEMEPEAVGAEPGAGAASANVLNPASTTRIGDYEVIAEIARGGMGIVYKARQRGLNRIVALKQIASQKLATPEMVLRFRMETEAIAKLDHPNIVPLYETGEHDGIQFFTMKLVEGGTLADWLASLSDNEKPATASPRSTFKRQTANARKDQMRELVSLLVKVCRSVAHAHRRGILHRDLKPGNILMDDEGEPHVSDFGLAKILEDDSGITHAQSILGSPNYMAPEQASATGESLTTAADIYSLGAILYEILTRDPPFKGGTPLETMRRVVQDEPRRPSTLRRGVGRDLETVSLRCLEKEPARRYTSADELADDLERWLKGEPVRARPTTAFEHAMRWMRRNPVIALACLIALASLAVLTVGSNVAATRIAVAKRATEDLLAQSQAREAERLLNEDRSADGLALLANVARQRPEDVDVARRLISALSQRRFAARVRAPIQHDSPVMDAIVRADKGWIGSVTEGGMIYRWNMTNGEPVRPPFLLADGLFDGRFSKSGSLLAVVTRDHQVELWSTEDVAKRIRIFRDSALSEVRHLALSPGGEWIAASGKFSKTIHVVNAENGKLIGSLTHPDTITGQFCFSDDGKRLAAGVANGSVIVWNVESRKQLPYEFAHEQYVMATAFSPDGRFVASASNDQTARIWDTETGVSLPWVARHRSEVTSVSFSADGRLLITTSLDLSARLWDVESGRPVCDPLRHREGVLGIAALSQPNLLGLISADEIGVWRVREAYAAPLLKELTPGDVSLAFSPGSDRLFTGEASGRVQSWNARTGESTGPSMAHPGPVSWLAFAPDGKSLGVAIRGNTAWIRRPDADDAIRLGHEKWVGNLNFDASGSRVITSSHDQTARIWDIRTGKLIVPPLRHDAAVFYAAISTDGRWALTGSRDMTARIWNAQTGAQLASLPHHSLVICAKFSPENDFFATASYDYRVRLWPFDSNTGAVDRDRRVTLVHKGEVTWLDFSPDGNWIATSSFDNTARVWNVHTGEPRPYLLEHNAPIAGVSFSPNGEFVITASYDRTARVWSVATGRPVTGPLRHAKSISRALFSPDGRSVATSSRDGVVKVWSLPQSTATDAVWLSNLAEYVAGEMVDANGYPVILDDEMLAERRSRLTSLSNPPSLVSWFLDQ